MTVLLRYDEERTFDAVFVVNGCLEARVSFSEAVNTTDFPKLCADRIAPLIWLAMPGHE